MRRCLLISMVLLTGCVGATEQHHKAYALAQAELTALRECNAAAAKSISHAMAVEGVPDKAKTLMADAKTNVQASDSHAGKLGKHMAAMLKATAGMGDKPGFWGTVRQMIPLGITVLIVIIGYKTGLFVIVKGWISLLARRRRRNGDETEVGGKEVDDGSVSQRPKPKRRPKRQPDTV